VPVLILLGVNENGPAYTFGGIGVAIVGCGLFFLALAGSKERSVLKDKAPSFKECFHVLKINKPLQKIVLSNVLGFARGLPVVAGMYIAVYLIVQVGPLERGVLNPVIAIGWAVSGFIGLLLTPKLYKKFNAKKIFIFGAIIGCAASVLMLVLGVIVGINNTVPLFIIIIICLLASGLPFGAVTNVNYTLIADSVDYVEHKTGRRAEGVIISLQTLMNKLNSALQAGVVSLGLFVINFAPPGEDKIPITQEPSTLWGFLILISLVPAIGWALSAIPMFFFDFIGDKREKIYAELAEMRKAKLENEDAAEVKEQS